MTKYETVKKLSEEEFRRLTGVKPQVFDLMKSAVEEHLKATRGIGGRRYKLSIEDRILLTLEYIREYRTLFHIAISYKISEETARRTSNFIEDILVKNKNFRLPGKKALLKSDNEFEVILVDVTESPIERPKKSKNSSILEKRNGIL